MRFKPIEPGIEINGKTLIQAIDIVYHQDHGKNGLMITPENGGRYREETTLTASNNIL